MMTPDTSHMPDPVRRTPSPARLAVAATCALLACHPCAGGTVPGDDPLVPERMMVRVPDPERLGALVAAASALFDDVAVIDRIDGREIHLLRYVLRPGQTIDAADAFCVAQVALGVAVWAELNYEGQSGEGKTDSFWMSQVTVDPSIFETQYAFPLIGLPAARDRSTGAGTLIAILDTGVSGQHPALGDSVRLDAVSFVQGAVPGDGGNGLDDDGDGLVDEQLGHGTFVAGLVHAVAPGARLLPVTVLNSDGIGDLWGIAKGMAHAIDAGADVINMSLGSTYSSALLEDIALEAETKGAVVVAAMGNLAREQPEEYPASLTTAFGVCATDDADRKAGFSNYNDKADLCAPGATVLVGTSVDPARAVFGPVPGGGYVAWEGTSFATAFVSGTAALARAQHPEWPDATVPVGAIPDRILQILTDSAVAIDASNPEFAGLLGAGRLSAAAATALGPPQPRVGDLNLDGKVDGDDLGKLLANWALPCGHGCRADLNRDGEVNADDLGKLLANWG